MTVIRTAKTHTFPVPVLFLSSQSPLIMALVVGSQFNSIRDAGAAMWRWVIDTGESYQVEKSEKDRYLLLCRVPNNQCPFRMLASGHKN